MYIDFVMPKACVREERIYKVGEEKIKFRNLSFRLGELNAVNSHLCR